LSTEIISAIAVAISITLSLADLCIVSENFLFSDSTTRKFIPIYKEKPSLSCDKSISTSSDKLSSFSSFLSEFSLALTLTYSTFFGTLTV